MSRGPERARPAGKRMQVTPMTLNAPPKSAAKGISHARPMPLRRGPATPPLNVTMTCETAFRTIARHYLQEMRLQHRGTSKGDTDALHQMRVALTRLRAAIELFRPMVTDLQQIRLTDELKWLNSHLGAVRDLDVAVERLTAEDGKRPREIQIWHDERDRQHRALARALGSVRYKRLIKSLLHWIEKGSWTRQRGKRAAKIRATAVTEYGARKLMRWQEKLVRRSHKLKDISARKRHRLRLMNKRLTYAAELVTDLISGSKIPNHQAMLKVLRKAQRSLGQLNDDERCRSIAATIGQQKTVERLLGPRHQRHLLRAAAAAYRKLAKLKPIRI